MNDTVQRDEAQLRQVFADQQTAMRDRDADALAARYAPGAVTFDLAPPLANAGPSVHDADRRRQWFATFDGPIEYEITELDITVGDGLAFARSLNRLAATPRGMSEGFELWFRATVCLRKSGGAWQIVHEHNSTPFYMDGSLRAAVDLKP